MTAFNGGTYRHRLVADVIAELRLIREKVILFVDDNLIGTRRDHLACFKELRQAMISERLTRPWICQATINFADDEELLTLARRAGCQGVFIGFESPTVEGLMAVAKKFNLQKGRETFAHRNRPSFKTFLVLLVANLSYRSNQFLDRRIYANRPEPAERRSHTSA